MDLKVGYLSSLSSVSLFIYYFIAFALAIYTFYRFGLTKYTLFIVIVFWGGLFYYLDSINLFSAEIYKIIVFLFAVGLFAKDIFSNNSKRDTIINIIFLLFTLSYFMALIINGYSLVTYLSQYSFKYFFPFIIYHGFKNLFKQPRKIEYFAKLLVFIIMIQVILSITKILSFGMIIEFIVGSMQFVGGGLGVVTPILGFLLYWLYRQGNLNTKHWLIAFSLLLIAIVSAKRTPVILFPIFILLATTFIKKGFVIKSFIKYGPIMAILFYVGVRSNFTLNPEGSSWGSFNIEYFYRYVLNYSFGTDILSEINETNTGRGNSILLLFSPSGLGFNNTSEMLWGKDLVSVVTSEMGRFKGGNYGATHIGLMSAAPTMLFQLGYVGFLLYLLFISAIIGTIKNKRFRLIVAFWFILDFLMYYNSTFLDNSMSVLMIFIIFYSNSILLKESVNNNITSTKPRLQT